MCEQLEQLLHLPHKPKLFFIYIYCKDEKNPSGALIILIKDTHGECDYVLYRETQHQHE